MAGAWGRWVGMICARNTTVWPARRVTRRTWSFRATRPVAWCGAWFPSPALVDATGARHPCLSLGDVAFQATYLHMDRIAARMPPQTITRGAPLVGYFLDHGNFDDTPADSYPAWMTYVVQMQNVSTAELLPRCLEAYASDPHKCFMAPYVQARGVPAAAASPPSLTCGPGPRARRLYWRLC